ncbi:MAG: hypothetical protein AB7N80_15040 [Bdellovibrionales bacterium]
MRYWMPILLIFSFLSSAALASEIGEPLIPLVEIEKARKRLYPGGRDEEDLKVLASLPESIRKTDERVIQKDVYKTLFNQELKNDAPEEASEPEIGH